jgi:hypothetical protein
VVFGDFDFITLFIGTSIGSVVSDKGIGSVVSGSIRDSCLWRKFGWEISHHQWWWKPRIEQI